MEYLPAQGFSDAPRQCPLLLKDPVIKKFIRYEIGNGNKNRGNQAFKESHGCGRTVHCPIYSQAVHHGVNNIAGFHYIRIVKIEDLIKARVKNIP